jgi:heat shock protein HslJ
VRRVAPLLLALAACRATAAERWDKVQDVEWRLVRIEGAPAVGDVSLTFAVGRLYGRAANRYGARYTRMDDALKIDAVAATKSFSTGGAKAIEEERRYLALLEKVDGYDFNGEELELRNGGATVLTFRRAPP